MGSLEPGFNCLHWRDAGAYNPSMLLRSTPQSLLPRFTLPHWHGPTLSLDHVQYLFFPGHSSTRSA